MADSANTFTSLKPIYKEAYSGPMKTHKRPGSNTERFANLKKKLKKEK